MPAYSFGDVILVPFPFTDQTGSKKRPAVIVSNAAYNQQRRDVVIMAITSRVRLQLPTKRLLRTGRPWDCSRPQS